MEIETEQEVTMLCVCPSCGNRWFETRVVPVVVEVTADDEPGYDPD